MDIRAPNTTRVVRALFKEQDEDRPVEFFFPPLLFSLSLSRPLFFSQLRKNTVYEYYAS